MNSEVIRYILKHRTIYTPEAIRKNLIEAGHNLADVDAAMRAVRSGRIPPPPPGEPPYEIPEGDPVETRPSEMAPGQSVADKPVFWAAFMGYAVALYGISFLLFQSVSGQVAVLFFLAALLAGIAGWVLLLRRNRPLALGLATGLLTVAALPFIGCIVIAGLCFGGGAFMG